MNMKTNRSVEMFIRDALSIDEGKADILICLREMNLKAHPEVQEEMKYGGVVFSVASELISGIFLRKQHVSLEFSLGMTMSDPQGHLQGNGKYRRHLKLINVNDIAGKNAGDFITQAFEQYQK